MGGVDEGLWPCEWGQMQGDETVKFFNYILGHKEKEPFFFISPVSFHLTELPFDQPHPADRKETSALF